MELTQIDPYYDVGTANLNTVNRNMTGQGTLWANRIVPGDQVYGADGRMGGIVETVNSNTSITLTKNWRGATQAGGAYTIYRVSDSVRIEQFSQRLLNLLLGGNISAFGELQGAANTLPYFDGAGSMDTTSITSMARTFLSSADEAAARAAIDVAQKQTNAFDEGSGKGLIVGAFGLGAHTLSTEADLDTIAPGTSFFRWGGTTANRPSDYGVGIQFERAAGVIQQLGVTAGGGIVTRVFNRGQTGVPWDPPIPPSVYQRSNILGSVSLSGGVPTGAIVERGSTSSGEYVRFADGTQICWGSAGTVGADTTITQNPYVFYSTSVLAAPFPAAFATIPNVACQTRRVSGTGVQWVVEAGMTISTTAVGNLRVGSNVGNLGTAEVTYLAIGRWF